MQELVWFLREGNIIAIRQCGYENQRIGDFSLIRTTKFDWKYLTPRDPPHWTDTDHGEILSLNHLVVPENYIVFIDWRFECIPQVTDRRGWLYKTNFEVVKTTPTKINDSQVRYRKWERILIEINDLDSAKHRLSQFLKYQSQFRSLCPSLLKAALRKFNYHFQFVMESERLNERDLIFSSSALRPGEDPCQWSIGPESNLTNDPRLFPIDELQNAKASLCSLIEGWEALHNFVPILYPNKDTEGWEYNVDFHQDSNWKSYLHIGADLKVRRRIWMRTCIRSEWLYKCKHTLTEYINFHPRGVSYMSPIEIYLLHSNDQGTWHRCIGILKDQIFELKFIDNNNKRIKYQLNLTEVGDIAVKGSYVFSLTKKGSNGDDLGSMCTLRTLTLHEKHSWIMQFISQLELIHNCSNHPLHPFGPPISDGVVIEGHMWKRGHIVPNWKFRFFQLRESGALTYYRNNHLKGRIQLKNCEIVDTANDFSTQCSFTIRKNSSYELHLKTTDRKTKVQWMAGIGLFCGNQPTTTRRKLKFPNKGPLYSYENIYNESQGIFRGRNQQVDLREENKSSRSDSADDRSTSDASYYSDFSASESLASVNSTSKSSVASSSAPTTIPTKNGVPVKSALKSSRVKLDEANSGKLTNLKSQPLSPSLPSQEQMKRKEMNSSGDGLENLNYKSLGASLPSPVSPSPAPAPAPPPPHSHPSSYIAAIAASDDDDDELDGGLYGLEEDQDQDHDHDQNAKTGEDQVWEDEEEEEEEEEEEKNSDLHRKSSFSVVSNLKELLSNHQDSAALMKILGGKDDDDEDGQRDGRDRGQG